MGHTYTCSVCSRALLRQSLKPCQVGNASRNPLRGRLPVSDAARFHHASSRLAAEVKTDASLTPKTLSQSKRNARQQPMASIAQAIRDRAPVMTDTYVAYSATQELVKACGKAGEYSIPEATEKHGEIPTDDNGVHLGQGTGWWYETLGMQPTFFSWAQITFLHMYMLQVRLRMLPDTHAPIWIQHLTNHAFYAAEDRLVLHHKFNTKSLRQKYLKDMFSQWRAVLLSYDEGIVKGDAHLAAALWRNLLGGRNEVDFEKLAQIVAYMRRELRRLDMATDDAVARGEWTFKGDPGEEDSVVRAPSRLMASEGPKA